MGLSGKKVKVWTRPAESGNVRHMRHTRALGSSLVGLLVPAFLALPVVTRPTTARPHRVAARMHRLDAHAASRPTRTKAFSAVGVTWAADHAVRNLDVLVRTRTAGAWTRWADLGGLADNEPDRAEASLAGARQGTRLAYPGPSDGVQVRVVRHSGPPVRDLRVELIDPGVSAWDAQVGRSPVLGGGVAEAVAPKPTIYSRADWGADESIRRCSPRYTSTILMGFVHHTDTPNDYSAADTAKWIRSLYAYHVQSNGWCDLGYNFVIDRFGRIWEGRAGGIDRSVLGAHTGGFNSKTFGVALLGTHISTPVPTATRSAVEMLFGWKFSLYGDDPRGHTTLVSDGGGTAKYREGVAHTFDNISGHRDAGSTECPGDAAYALLGRIRAETTTAPAGAEIRNPSVSPGSQPIVTTTPFTVRANFPRQQRWWLTFTAPNGAVVRRFSGARRGDLSVPWDLRDANGLPVTPARYRLLLTVAVTGYPARSWPAYVTITTA